MKQALYHIVALIALVHDRIMAINDSFPTVLSDKQLHFLVVGIVGMLLLFVIHPLFVFLTKRGHVLAVSWIYVFTLIIVLTFSVEIGQQITHTGVLDFADIVYGVLGFFIFFAIFALVRGIVMLLAHWVKGDEEDD